MSELLAAAGYEDYHAFMRAAFPAEVLRRASRLSDTHYQALASVAGRRAFGRQRDPVRVRSMSAFLAVLVTDLTRYAEVGTSLADHASYLRAMGDDVRLFALNAQIGASRLGEQGAALDAVARLLTEQSQATSPLVATVAERAARAVLDIEDMTLQLSLSTIQAEMVAVFAHELCAHPEIQTGAARNMLALADALKRGTDRTFSALGAVSQQLVDVLEHVDTFASASTGSLGSR